MKETILSVDHLAKSFGQVEILKDINLDIQENDVLSIIGPSGSGKSTLLRCLNLLEKPSSGDILFHDQSILDDNYNIRKYRST